MSLLAKVAHISHHISKGSKKKGKKRKPSWGSRSQGISFRGHK